MKSRREYVWLRVFCSQVIADFASDDDELVRFAKRNAIPDSTPRRKVAMALAGELADLATDEFYRRFGREDRPPEERPPAKAPAPPPPPVEAP